MNAHNAGMETDSTRTRSYPLKEIVLLFFLPWIVYALSLNGDFVYDDVAITVVENPLLHGEISLTEVLLQWDRPLREITYLLDHALWGFQPIGYHLQNVLWHSANTVLIYFFLCFLGLPQPVFFLTALLFAVHPLSVESVAWISGRKELLCFFFEMAACFSFVYAVMSESKRRNVARLLYFASIISVLLALLAKQVAVVLPLLLFLTCRFYAQMRNRSFCHSAIIKAILPHVLLTVFFTLFSFRLFEQLHIVENRGTFYDPASRDVAYSFLSACLTPFATALKSIWLCVWPMDLTVEHGFSPVVKMADPRWLGGLIMVVFLLIIAYKSYSKIPAIWFGLLWFALSWAPVSGAVPVGYLLAERYLYIPCFGFLVAFTCGYFWLRNHLEIRANGHRKKVLAYSFPVFLATIGLFFSARTMMRTLDWRSEIALWESAKAARPANAKVRFNVGNAYRDAGRKEEAFEQWRNALELQPNYPQVWVTIGNAEKRRGQFAEAERGYREALALEPEYGLAHYNLAHLFAAQEKKELALQHYKLAAEYLYGKRSGNRWKGMAYYQIAKLLFERGEKELAWNYLIHAESLAPNHAPIYLLIGLLKQDQPDIARRAFQTAIELDANYSEAFYNLGVLEWQFGRQELAETYWSQALRLNPNLETGIRALRSHNPHLNEILPD
jgi:tetratricopeptide (TPR) repeat protein